MPKSSSVSHWPWSFFSVKRQYAWFFAGKAKKRDFLAHTYQLLLVVILFFIRKRNVTHSYILYSNSTHVSFSCPWKMQQKKEDTKTTLQGASSWVWQHLQMTKHCFVFWEIPPVVLESHERMPILQIYASSVSGPAAIPLSPFSVDPCAEEDCGHTTLGVVRVIPQKKYSFCQWTGWDPCENLQQHHWVSSKPYLIQRGTTHCYSYVVCSHNTA